jgi:hypothetical protein
MDDQGSTAVKCEIFLFSMSFRPALGPTLSYQWLPRAISPEVKRPQHEADHSHSSNDGAIRPLPNTLSWHGA